MEPGAAGRPRERGGPGQAGIPIDRPDPGGLAPNAPEWHPAGPDEIAAAIVYLASEEESGTVTGEVLRLPGGDTPCALSAE